MKSNKLIDTFEQRGLLIVDQLFRDCTAESQEAGAKLTKAQQILKSEFGRLSEDLEADQVQMQSLSRSNAEAFEQSRASHRDQVEALDALIGGMK